MLRARLLRAVGIGANLVCVGLLAGAAGCAGANTRGAGVAAAAEKRTAPPFADWEGSWLAELGALDPRLAARMPVPPGAEVVERVAAAAVVRGDKDVGIVGGALDLFSFGDRDRKLHALGVELVRQPDDGTLASRDERMLLGRLLEGEELRVAWERQSPESASERVRAMVATWGHPGSTREVDEREHLVQRGLEEVILDVRAGRLSHARGLELEDSLDPLERLAVPEGYPEATRAIAALRVELGKAHAPVAPSASTLAAELETYLGGPRDREALAARLEEEEATLRSEATGKLRALARGAAEEILAAAAGHVDAEASCPRPETISGGSRVRAMSPPEERVLVCDVLERAADAPGANMGNDEAVAAVVLHDDVAIALWAVALDGGATDLDATRTAHPLLASVPPARQDRLVRAALVSPVRAIAPGLAAAIVDAEGPSESKSRAIRWLAFGDAPFDIVIRHLAEKN